MVTSIIEYEIERFIKPIHGLYKEYITTVEDFTTKNSEIMVDKVVNESSIQDGFLIYELFGDGEDGEIEKVQTWICDNHMEVTSAVSTVTR